MTVITTDFEASKLRDALKKPLKLADGPTPITDWIDRRLSLHGLPFHYLVPDPRMLPQESLRFFIVDMDWVSCLIDGALSPGRLGGAVRVEPPSIGDAAVSGFLLRSELLAGWPGLEVRAYDSANTPLHASRLELVEPGLLLGLFQGMLTKVTFSEPPEGLHFGIDLPAHPALTGAGVTVKAISPSSEATPRVSNTSTTVASLFRDERRRVLDVSGTAAALAQQAQAMGLPAPSAFTPAEFAIQMAAGTQSAAFVFATSS